MVVREHSPVALWAVALLGPISELRAMKMIAQNIGFARGRERGGVVDVCQPAWCFASWVLGAGSMERIVCMIRKPGRSSSPCGLKAVVKNFGI